MKMKSAHSLLVALFALVTLFATSPTAYAAPVWGKDMQLRQPDGTLVPVKIWGDEFYQIVETPDGYTLIRDPKSGVICFAVMGPDGQRFVSSGRPYDGNAVGKADIAPHVREPLESVQAQVAAARQRLLGNQPQSKAGIVIPSSGEVLGLCLIIDFSDDVATIPAATVEALCNEPGYNGPGHGGALNDGSVRDYFLDVSDGKLDYSNHVPTAYYRAKHPKTYYDNPTEHVGLKAMELITEALDDLEANGFDFSQLDSTGDGVIDAINCFYAGYVHSGWNYGLWPHSGVIGYTADGVTALAYQITDMESSLEIGTFCHENGHQLCRWPDLYDYDYDSRGAGMYCLMASGNMYGTQPIEPCAFLKERVGWSEVIPLIQPVTGLSLTAGVNRCYKYQNPSNINEYYLIEVRHQSARDTKMPDSGLAIWHVDRMGSNNYNQMTPTKHYQASILQADGLLELENDINRGDADDLYGAPDAPQCTHKTTPNTGWWSGEMSGIRVLNISEPATTMTFDFVGGLGVDSDGDGLKDWDEMRDLDPVEPGIQNPFDPDDSDSTGDNEFAGPDGKEDGENDWDGDGGSNLEELTKGTDPLDPQSYMPAVSGMGLGVIAVALAFLARRRVR